MKIAGIKIIGDRMILPSNGGICNIYFGQFNSRGNWDERGLRPENEIELSAEMRPEFFIKDNGMSYHFAFDLNGSKETGFIREIICDGNNYKYGVEVAPNSVIEYVWYDKDGRRKSMEIRIGLNLPGDKRMIYNRSKLRIMESESILNGQRNVEYLTMIGLNNTRTGSERMGIGQIAKIDGLGFFIKRTNMN